MARHPRFFSTMDHSDPVLRQEIPVIRKIIDDETWLEGERRGCSVSSQDHVVRERVCEVVLRIGQDLRDSLSAMNGPVLGVPGSVAPIPGPNANGPA